MKLEIKLCMKLLKCLINRDIKKAIITCEKLSKVIDTYRHAC